MNPPVGSDMRQDLDAGALADRLLDRLDHEAVGIGCDLWEMPCVPGSPAPRSCFRAAGCAAAVQR